MNKQLKEIRKALRPFKQLIKERNYLTLSRLLVAHGIAEQVDGALFSLTCADAYKLSTPYRRPRNVVLAGHILLSAIEIALAHQN